MLVTLLGIMTSVSPVQPLKASPTIFVTLFGIVMDVRLEHP